MKASARETLRPTRRRATAAGQDRVLLIAAADELEEEQVRRVGLEWQITKFIGDFSGAPRVLELEP
jgi:hypothetical protein